MTERRFRVPLPGLPPRSRSEENRTSTPLELFFDLCFVSAVAQAGARLVHALGAGQFAHGVIGYCIAFFALWWAWVNFTWFASAYDNGDVLYRIVTLVQISGALVLSAGVPRAFESADLSIAVIGYVIMRLALAFQWLRAAAGTAGAARATALRYIAGLITVQLGWVGATQASYTTRLILFPILAVVDVAVPVLSEYHHRTPWHPHHIAERYELFTLIVLGEAVTAASLGVQSALDERGELATILPIALGGLLIVFSAFRIYFVAPAGARLTTGEQPFVWGYGHYVIAGSAAAIGAGIEVAVEQTDHQSPISALAASAAVTLPTALFVLAVWLLHARHFKRDVAEQCVLPVTALLVLACTFAGHWTALLAGAVAAVSVGVSTLLEERRAEHLG
ncbi:low temperature requirement protein A [Actinomadura rayongensis]|uniref:Low temperature requirement protein A n=1 Tax=Actinomadura rayongensis TaxID=1429076 RepID=A0A6I4WGD5_9ACTN|nr:low temperature requirement protein A [Actinomadura rayongensis]MXQ66876.1 low temperature requirement protein A [Actinomadura rayongensis]